MGGWGKIGGTVFGGSTRKGDSVRQSRGYARDAQWFQGCQVQIARPLTILHRGMDIFTQSRFVKFTPNKARMEVQTFLRPGRSYLEVADPQLILVGGVENINFELIAIVANVGGVPRVVPHAVGAGITVTAVQGIVNYENTCNEVNGRK